MPKTRHQWAISLAGQGISSFCEEHGIHSEESMEEYIEDNNTDELIELAQTVIRYFVSEMDEDNKWSLYNNIEGISCL